MCSILNSGAGLSCGPVAEYRCSQLDTHSCVHNTQTLFFWLCWVFITVLSSLAASRGYSSLAVWGLLIGVASLVVPVSPALAGRFPTTGPPGKSYRHF